MFELERIEAVVFTLQRLLNQTERCVRPPTPSAAMDLPKQASSQAAVTSELPRFNVNSGVNS